MLKHKVLYLFILVCYPTIAVGKNMLDISTQWQCVFPVDHSGTKPNGNFFECKKTGCNEDSYHQYKTPETYTSVIDFIVNFRTEKISYKWAVPDSKRQVKKTRQQKKIDYLMEEFDFTAQEVKHWKGPSKNILDSVIIVDFLESKKEIEILNNWEFVVHRLYFYKGGRALLWSQNSFINFRKEQSMDTTTAYGRCEPLK